MPVPQSPTSGLMPQACERCWKRKQKCDRRKPTCRHCKASNSPCIERRLGNVLDPSDPHAHHSYIESLKGRVRTLETQVQQSASPAAITASAVRQSSIGAGAGAGAGVGSGSSVSPKDHTVTSRDDMQRRPSGVSPRSQSVRPPPADSLHDEMGYLPLSAMAEQWQQPFSNQQISFQTQVQAATCASGSNPAISYAQNPAIFGQLGDFHRNLLRQGVNLTTIETGEPFARFMDLLRHAIPFISPDQLTQDHQEVLQAYKDNQVGDVITENPTRIILVHLAVATGILLSKDYRYMESYATALALTSYQLVPRAVAQSTDLEVAQVLTMMVVFSIYSSFGGSTWHLLDLATTRCLAAGMHNATTSGSESEDPDKEDSRRIFWVIYMLDVFVSFSLDRPFQIQDEDITTTPPSSSGGQGDFAQLQSWNVQHAMLLHAVRRDSSKGILFHYSNYRYWRDTAPLNNSQQDTWMQRYHVRRMCCRSLVSILSLAEAPQQRRLSLTVTEHAEQEFSGFLAVLEEQFISGGCAMSTFDGIDVFNTGVALVYTLVCRSPSPGPGPLAPDMVRGIVRVGHRAMRILAAISERFASVRGLYEIIGAFTTAVQCGDGAWAPIEALIQNAELLPSRAVERLMRMTVEAGTVTQSANAMG